MLIKKRMEGPNLIVELTGPIEETVNFEALVGPPPKSMHVNCKRVSRINSAGVKAWIKYFQHCTSNGTQLKFIECSVQVIEQMNLVKNFLCNGTIESLDVPFFCSICKKQLTLCYQVSDLRKVSFKLEDPNCPDCSSYVTFDDDLDDYFAIFRD